MMLNPSTADANVDDATIRRCIGFAREWGYGALVVWNLYAYRATDPAELTRAADPIGRRNEEYLWSLLQAPVPPALIIAAWGAKPNHGIYTAREASILALLHDRQVHVLGLTADGHPRHPVRLRKALRPIPWHPEET